MAALAGLVVLVGMIASLAGPVCLFAPHKLGLNSRWYALPLSTLFIAAVGIGMMISPQLGQANAEQNVAGTGIVAFLLWVILAYAAYALANRDRTTKPAQPDDVVANPTRTAAEVDERRRIARRQARGATAMEPAPTHLGSASRISIEEQLEDARSRFKRGEIDAGEYSEAIDDADNDLVDREEDLAADRSLMDDDDYEEARQQLRDVAAEIRKHRKLASMRAYTESISRPDFADRGKWARFEYTDSDGVVTKRNIAMWERRGGYIVGFDRSKNAERTFRQDRISDWVCG